jgi:hypothetical protein
VDAVPEIERNELDADTLQQLVDDALMLEGRDDVPILVPQLPPQTFVRIARHLREENRLELLLPWATPTQLSSLLDLDGWRRDRVDYPRTRQWLSAIAETYRGVDRDRGDLVDTIYAMDPELWTVALAAGTMVIDLDPSDDDARDQAFAQLGELRGWETPDGFFIVGVPDDEFGYQALATISRVYEDDLSEGRKLCLSIQSLLTADAEEDLLRWRSGRLADLGFVDWEEAMKLFRPLDAGAAADQAPADFAYLSEPSALERTVSWQGPDLLRRVMSRLPDAEHGLRAREFLLLVNEVMAAQRFEPGDETLQERAIDQTQSTLSLGLEMLASARPGHPDIEGFLADRVRALGLRATFRVGYGALDKLKKAAGTLHREGRVSLRAPGSLLDRPWGPGIATLVARFPELPLAATSKGTRPIRGLRDVAIATRLVAEAGALAQLCFLPEGYACDPIWIGRVDEPERLTLGDLVRTAIVHAHLPGSSGALAPLTPDDLAWARANLVVAEKLVPTVKSDFEARCRDASIEAHTDALATVLLPRLLAELSSVELQDGKPDLAKTGGLLTIQTVSVWLRTTAGDA